MKRQTASFCCTGWLHSVWHFIPRSAGPWVILLVYTVCSFSSSLFITNYVDGLIITIHYVGFCKQYLICWFQREINLLLCWIVYLSKKASTHLYILKSIWLVNFLQCFLEHVNKTEAINSLHAVTRKGRIFKIIIYCYLMHYFYAPVI